MTAADVILGARELDPSFSSERHTTRVAVHFLSRLVRRLVGEWVKHEEVAASSTFEVTFPLATFSAGVELNDGDPLQITSIKRPLDLYLKGREEAWDLELIEWSDRNRRRDSRCAWIQNNRIYFSGEAEDWNDIDRVVLTYTATPADITDPNAELVLPSTAEDVLVTHLAAFFAKRSNQAELARPRREYVTDAFDAEALWIDELQRRQGATVSRTRSSW